MNRTGFSGNDPVWSSDASRGNAGAASLRGEPGKSLTPTVVIVNDNARVTGGADKVALTSAIELARCGLRVILFAAVGPIAPELQQVSGLEIVFTDQNEILHEPSRLRAATQGLWNGKSAAMAATLFDRLDPAVTVVHLHLWAKALSSSVIYAAKKRGFRVVCTLHQRTWASRLLGSDTFDALGRVSYLIYILQAPLWHFYLVGLNRLHPVSLPGNVCLTVFASTTDAVRRS